MFKKILKIVSIIALIASIYTGYIVLKTPKADLKLDIVTSSFEMPKELDVVFDQLHEEDRKKLLESYSKVVKNTQVNTIIHAGLHNYGYKLASDIRISFPKARFISVHDGDGKEIQFSKGETNVDITKLLPKSSVYLVVWGYDMDGKNTDPISGVHSEGTVTISPLVELPASWKWVHENWRITVMLCLILILPIALFILFKSNERPTQSHPPDD